MTLTPAKLLPHGGHQLGGLFIIDTAVVIPQNPLAGQGCLHLNFEVFRQAHGGPAAPLIQVSGGNGKACAADGAVQPPAMLGQLEESVGNGVAGVVEPGHDALLVLGTQIALNEIRLVFVQVLTVHFPEHVPIHQVIRIEDHQQIIFFLIVAHGFQCLFQGNGLAGCIPRVFPVGLNHLGTVAACHLCRSVCAVIRNDVEIIQLLGIIHGL